MKGAIDEADRLVAETGNAIMQQFANPANPASTRHDGAKSCATRRKIDIFVAAVGTGYRGNG